MVTQIISGLIIFAAVYSNICIILFSFAGASGPWATEIIRDFYLDFKEHPAYVMLVLNISAIISTIYLIFR